MVAEARESAKHLPLNSLNRRTVAEIIVPSGGCWIERPFWILERASCCGGSYFGWEAGIRTPIPWSRER